MRLLLAVLCGSIAFAQTTARITGHVLSQSGGPVRKATVRLTSSPVPQPGQAASITTYIELSDGAGMFAFDDLPPGRYTLSASRTGYTTPNSIGSARPPITVHAGETKTDAEFRLIQLGVISGRVIDQDGDPVVGIQVQAMHVVYNSRRQLVNYTTVSSDDQGNFRIANLAPGRYYPMVDNFRRLSSATVGADERVGRSAQEGDINTFYPSAPDFSGAVGVNVAAGQETQSVNIRMLRGRAFSIRGRAIDSRTGAPVAGQMILRPKATGIGIANNMVSVSAQSATGRFEFRGVLPGTYALEGSPGAQMVRNGDAVTSIPGVVGHMELTVGNSDLEGVVLSLSPPAEITGSLHLDEGDFQTLRGSGVPGARIVLRDLEETVGGTPSGQVLTDGTFRIQNLGFSRYSVTVNPVPQGTYVKSIRLGGADVTRLPFEVSGSAGGVLDIVLSRKVAEVTGVLQSNNGENVSGLAVSIWSKTPAAIDPMLGRTFRTDANGSVKLADLPPGEYYIGTWEEIDLSLLSYPDFLARFRDQATTVKLAENDKTTVDLRLISKEKIAAEVANLP